MTTILFYVKSRQEISMKQIFIDVNVMTKYTVDFFVTKSVKGGGRGGETVCLEGGPEPTF